MKWRSLAEGGSVAAEYSLWQHSVHWNWSDRNWTVLVETRVISPQRLLISKGKWLL